jgi:LuxR family transcriptional regulator, maltose regulon positive regulatory protein
VTEVVDAPPAPPLLVYTKLSPPVRGELVSRPALVERLCSGPPRSLTVVRAPAGWGKTTLLATWARQDAARRFAWLSLEPADAEPARFWMYLVAALGQLRAGLGAEALALLRAPGVDVERDGLPVLLNDIARLDAPAVLVLDDYHVIESEAVHQAMGFVVEHLPPRFEIAMATRTEPPLPLARLRARGQLLEVRPELLRFSAGEADVLLNDLLRLGLRDEEVDALCRRTEGWAAGLYLAALSLRDRPDRGAFLRDFAGDDRHVVDYLAAEVLANVGDDVREFLLRTSILDRLSARLCNAILDSDAGARLLEGIERSNLFLVALDERRRWYRYHHLFADLLRHELERTHPDLVPELHRRAAAWHAAEGDVDRAIHHTVAAGDHAAAAELVAAHWTGWLLGRGDHGTVDAWLNALPADLIRSDPRLCVARTIVLQSLGRQGVEEWLDAGEAAAGPNGDPGMRLDLAAARAAQRIIDGDVAGALAAADAAVALAGAPSEWLPVAHGARAHALRWRGDAEGAQAAFHDYLQTSRERAQPLGVVSSLSSLALIDAEAGRWSRAVGNARRALELAQHALREHWMMMDAHLALAFEAARRGDRATADRERDRAAELARRGGVPGGRANALLGAAQLLAAAGAAAESAVLVAEASGILAPCRDAGAMVLERLRRAEAAVHVRSTAAAVEHLGEPITEREMAVLRLLASQLTQREIGDALHVSVNTVKSHTKSIFRKLGASDRADAVARARTVGLL